MLLLLFCVSCLSSVAGFVKFEQATKKESGSEGQSQNLYGENYSINRKIFLLLEPSEIDRSAADKAKVVDGTNSHYAYEARTVPAKLSLKRYSCYCSNFSARKFTECKHWNMWWSRKYREELKEDGWHEYQMQFVADRDAYALLASAAWTRAGIFQAS